MLLYEVATVTPEPGTYAAVSFSNATIKAIRAYCDANKIPKPVPDEKLHCTLLYSRKHCEYTPKTTLTPPLTATPKYLSVWESKSKDGDGSVRCLVLEFACPELVKRHKQLMDDLQATYDFPDYKPHVTLSYDIEDMDESTLPDVKSIGDLEIIGEYGEDLDSDWKNKLDTK